MIESFLKATVDLISNLGYAGIFFGMLLESSFIPFPSEIIMIPAGYLVYKQEMNIWIVISIGTLGSVCGAVFNYYLARIIGRPILIKFGKYFLISEKSFAKAENFFKKHGTISTLTGRLIPVIRQLISIPAGAFHMKMIPFLSLTAIGSIVWISILVVFGFLIGKNQELIHQYLPMLKIFTICFASVLVIGYIIYTKRKSKVCLG